MPQRPAPHNHNPTLTTDRLILRLPVPEDAEDMLVFRGDPVVQKYNSVPLAHAEEARDYIEKWLLECKAGERKIWGITLKEEGTMIGMVGLGSWRKHDRRAEVGYDMARAYWGRGIGTEAVRAAVCFGFEHMNLNRIEAATIADNMGSVRLLEKLGFTREGTLREYSLEQDGRFHDEANYGILKREFLP
ncbi:MAG: GNAT family N-acetyltransferase [Candidatus Latescibacteria bacterium]|nr:GNAT family N-acetyltransferase [Candidatus Latescibacterota bacterium]